MEVLRPGLFLTHIQGESIVNKTDEAIRSLFAAAGRPVRLSFAQYDPREGPGSDTAPKVPPPPPRRQKAGGAAQGTDKPRETANPRGEQFDSEFVYNWKTGL